jgi:two-component system chemotaxis response regulator CheB
VKPVRVLVVDAAGPRRAAIVRLLGEHAGIVVVGESTGRSAVDVVRRLRPQVVLIAGELAHDAGIEATKQIMVDVPTPVVVTIGVEAPASDLADRALRAGAVCVVPRPMAGARDADAARRLVETVRAMAEVRVVRHARPAAVEALRQERGPQIVAIAASTGGPAALQTILADLPVAYPLPIVVVQHISRGFTAGFVNWLAGRTRVAVKIAEAGEPLVAGCVYVAPDDRHLGVTAKSIVELSTAPPIGGFRPSASYLFTSVAGAFGTQTLAVILTGMGNDGLSGLADVRTAGGYVLAQDEASSVIFGMPGAAVAAGVADEVLSLGSLAARIGACGGPRGRTAAVVPLMGGR